MIKIQFIKINPKTYQIMIYKVIILPLENKIKLLIIIDHNFKMLILIHKLSNIILPLF